MHSISLNWPLLREEREETALVNPRFHVCTSLAPRPMTVVFGLRTRLRVRMRTTFENGVLCNGQQPGSAVKREVQYWLIIHVILLGYYTWYICCMFLMDVMHIIHRLVYLYICKFCQYNMHIWERLVMYICRKWVIPIIYMMLCRHYTLLVYFCLRDGV